MLFCSSRWLWSLFLVVSVLATLAEEQSEQLSAAKVSSPFAPVAAAAAALARTACEEAPIGASVAVQVSARAAMGGTRASETTLTVHCPSAVSSVAVTSANGAAAASSHLSPLLQMIVAWIIVWLLAYAYCQLTPTTHVFLPPEPTGTKAWLRSPGPGQQKLWRRVGCAQVHALGCVLAGAVLAIRYRNCSELDGNFTRLHEVAFVATVGHRIVAAAIELGMAVIPGSSDGVQNFDRVVFALDHLLGAYIPMLCLVFRHFSVLGVATGLLTELSALPSNLCAGLRLRRLLNALPPQALQLVWDSAIVLAVLTRGIPLALYVDGLLQSWPVFFELPFQELWHGAVALRAVSSAACLWMLVSARARDLVDVKSSSNSSGDVELTVSAVPQHLGGRSSSSSCWLVVHGRLYDVGDFIHTHPGGRENLLRYAGGADATDAFEAVGHSSQARERLMSLPSAPLSANGRHLGIQTDGVEEGLEDVSLEAEDYPTTKVGSHASRYDFMVQPPAAGTLALAATHVAAGVAGLLGTRKLPGERSMATAILGIAALGTVVAVSSLPDMLKSGQASWLRIAPGPSAAGACLVALVVAVQLAPARSLALGFAATVLAENCSSSGRTSSGSSALRLSAPAAWALLSYHAVPLVGEAGAQLGACSFTDVSIELLTGLAWAAIATLLLPVLTRSSTSMQSTASWAGLWAISVWAVLCIISSRQATHGGATALVWAGVDKSEVLPALVGSTGVAVLACGFLWTLTDLSGHSIPRAASTWAGLLLSMGFAVFQLRDAASVCGGLALLGSVLQARQLMKFLEAAAHTPRHNWDGVPVLHDRCVCAQFLVDNARAIIAMAIWGTIGRYLRNIVSWMLPAGLRVYAFEAPIDDFGGHLRAGVCLMLEGEQTKPGHVVCNVGHLPTADLEDIRSTVKHSLDIMRELSGRQDHSGLCTRELHHSQVPGFIANVLCVIPECGGGKSYLGVDWSCMRQINLSVWSDQASAGAWYRGSEAHAAVLKEHQGGPGGLRTFGNLLLSMSPLRVAWQRRCRACTAVVEGLETDQCSRCAGPTFPIPAF